ncbi:MAG: hypothetical protein OEY48_00870 [Gammaproteobacteria bacterium]|nr:hypothetical protein [Gammaproteobacteria bacterium]MDH5591381.1 hypothetical protein [Gammaproteobacteria bacterium]
MMEHSLNSVIKIRIFTALISLFLSTFAYYSDDIINRDGILYMDMAAAFLQGGLTETAKLYDWPFFSIIVAYLHKLTTLPLQISAGVLNSLLFILLTDTLILISNKTLPNSRQLAFAALFILCFQMLNEYREFIIRDIGYWAFCSLALYRFMVFLESPSLKNASIWQLVAIVAVLFRIEGVVLLLGLPLYLFATQHPKIALKQGLQLSYLLLICAVIASVLTIGQSGLTHAFSKISSVSYYIDTSNFVTSLSNKTDILADQILNKYSERYSALILVSGLITMLFYKLINALSIGYVGLYLFSWWQNKNYSSFPYQRLLAYFTALNLVILLAFLFKEYFISTRYSVMALLGLLLLILPAICRGIEYAWLSKNRIYITVVSVILLVGLVDGLTQSNSKSYIKNTAISASQDLPGYSKVLTDDKFIDYYFRTHKSTSEISQEENLNNYQNYNYMIVVEKRRNVALKDSLKSMAIEPVHAQENKRGDRATIYRIIP